MIKAEKIWDGKPELAEGPVWHQDAFWWVDITLGRLNRWDPETGLSTCHGIGETLGAALPMTDGRWFCAGRYAVHALDWDTGELETLATLPDPAEYIRFNDAKTDPVGRVWAGTLGMGGNKNAGAFYLYGEGKLEPVFTGITCSNGMAWNAARTRMYYIDTPTYNIDILDYDIAAGTVTNRRPLVEIPKERGGPDGMCIDDEDNLWCAHWGGRAVHCYHGTTGELLETIEVDGNHVTSCCFGGENLDELYITVACDKAMRLDGPCEGGGLFRAKPGVTGPAVTLAAV